MPEPTATRAIRNRLQRWRLCANLVKKIKKIKKTTEQCCIGKQDFERYLKPFKRSILHIAQLLKKKTGWICKTNCRVTWVPEVFSRLWRGASSVACRHVLTWSKPETALETRLLRSVGGGWVVRQEKVRGDYNCHGPISIRFVIPP